MTYGNNIRKRSGYCRGWQSFWLVFRPRGGQLQPLECPLHNLRRRMSVPLRYRCDTVMLL